MKMQATPSDGAGLEHYVPAIIRIAAWCILVCSTLYFSVVMLEGLLRPDYHVSTMFISELALGSRGSVQILNFIVSGLSILLFAMGVAFAFGTTRAGRIGVTLLVILGICQVAAGVFVIDPVPTSGLTFSPLAIGPHHMSFHSKFHYVVSSLSFFLAPICAFCFVFADRSADDANWQAFRRWSLVLGIGMALGLTLLKLAVIPPPTNPMQPWRGLIQRAMVLPFDVWLFAFGVVLLKRGSPSPRHSRSSLSEGNLDLHLSGSGKKIIAMKIDRQTDTKNEDSSPSGKSRKRPWLFGALTAVLWVGVMWGAAELFVRLVIDDGMRFDLEMWKYARDVKMVSTDPLIGHQHRPNRQAHLMGVDFATNSQGLRDYEYRYERTPGTLRIVMLGDSFTVGWGVAAADTSSKRLERLFAQDGTKAEVINTGVGNWNTVQEVEYFLTEGFKYRPDVVVLNFVFNDAEPVPSGRPPGFLMRHCYSCIFVIGRVDALMRELAYRQDWAAYYLGLFDHGKAPGWLDAKAYLRKLADYCSSHGIKLLVASFPELHDVQHYRLQEITDLIKQAADENGVAFIDLLDSVKNQDSSSLWITPSDPHPSSLADKFFADALYQKLRTLQ